MERDVITLETFEGERFEPLVVEYLGIIKMKTHRCRLCPFGR